MPHATTFTGGCLCGAIRYGVGVRPERIGLCYCRSCRLAAGATPVGWVTVPRGAFAWQRGEPVRHTSSPATHRTHCGTCGTSLTYAAEEDDTLDVTLATIDRAEALAPRRALWLGDRLPWAPLDRHLPHHVRGADGPLWRPAG